MGQPPGIFVVSSHIDVGFRAFQFLGLLCLFKRSLRSSHIGEPAAGAFMAVNPSGTEKYDGVLNLFASKARQWLTVLRQQAENSAVGTVKKLLVLIGERSGLEFHIVHK